MSNTANEYPPGLDAERVREIIEHYESQTDEDLAAEIEAAAGDDAAFAPDGHTAMVVPNYLVPAVRALVAEVPEPAAAHRS